MNTINHIDSILRLGGDTYSGNLLAYTSSTAGDEDDLARHVWHIRSCELGATGKDVVVDDSTESSHVGCETAKGSKWRKYVDAQAVRPRGRIYREPFRDRVMPKNWVLTRNVGTGAHRGIRVIVPMGSEKIILTEHRIWCACLDAAGEGIMRNQADSGATVTP